MPAPPSEYRMRRLRRVIFLLCDRPLGQFFKPGRLDRQSVRALSALCEIGILERSYEGFRLVSESSAARRRALVVLAELAEFVTPDAFFDLDELAGTVETILDGVRRNEEAAARHWMEVRRKNKTADEVLAEMGIDPPPEKTADEVLGELGVDPPNRERIPNPEPTTNAEASFEADMARLTSTPVWLLTTDEKVTLAIVHALGVREDFRSLVGIVEEQISDIRGQIKKAVPDTPDLAVSFARIEQKLDLAVTRLEQKFDQAMEEQKKTIRWQLLTFLEQLLRRTEGTLTVECSMLDARDAVERTVQALRQHYKKIGVKTNVILKFDDPAPIPDIHRLLDSIESSSSNGERR